MAQSPGHQQRPDHKVRETAVLQTLQVSVGHEIIADSQDVIEVDEDGHPKRLYFARADVKEDVLKKSDTKTTCPFKGKASYYHLTVNGKTFEDAAWSYEEPYDEHRGLKDRLAFARDKFDAIRIQPKP